MPILFLKTKPIWITDKEREMNVHAVFRTEVCIEEGMELHVTGYSFYRVFVNGEFIGFGPARAAHGYAREDVLCLGKYKNTEKKASEIMIEVVGYYCKSLSTVIQPSYLMAEIQWEGEVSSYTGRDFEGFLPNCKVQKAERYSVQRHFCEVWDYRDVHSFTEECYKVAVKEVPIKLTVLDRTVPYPLYENIQLKDIHQKGLLNMMLRKRIKICVTHGISFQMIGEFSDGMKFHIMRLDGCNAFQSNRKK